MSGRKCVCMLVRSTAVPAVLGDMHVPGYWAVSAMEQHWCCSGAGPHFSVPPHVCQRLDKELDKQGIAVSAGFHRCAGYAVLCVCA